MLNKLMTALTVSIIVLTSVPTMAQEVNSSNFIDQEQIGDWSKDYVEVLVSLGVLEGYPDGTFRPTQNITREEFSVALMKGLVVLEERLLTEQYAGDEYLYNEIVNLQSQLFSALTRINEVEAAQLAKKNNFIGIQIGYTPDRDGDTNETFLELNGKIQVIEINNKFAVSVRPFVNTNTEIGGSLTLDYDITEDLEVYAGMGAAYRADEDSVGSLTGFDNDVVPYVNAGVSLDLSQNTSLYLDGKMPIDSKEGKEPVVGIGISLGW